MSYGTGGTWAPGAFGDSQLSWFLADQWKAMTSPAGQVQTAATYWDKYGVKGGVVNAVQVTADTLTPAPEPTGFPWGKVLGGLAVAAVAVTVVRAKRSRRK